MITYVVYLKFKTVNLEHIQVIDEISRSYHFTKLSGLYIGDPCRVTSVTCVLFVQNLSEKFEWFSEQILESKMFRVTDQTDLFPVVRRSKLSLVK